jgi:nitrite reductase/ring-hydroxylating ferredoxin subunit
MTARRTPLLVCSSDDLAERTHVGIELLYEGQIEAVVVFRFEGDVYAYINRCVHMPKRLDCERDIIFDDNRQLLRCSMHGIVYEPMSGASVSTMCHGEQLRPVRVQERDGVIQITDKRARALPLDGEASRDRLDQVDEARRLL